MDNEYNIEELVRNMDFKANSFVDIGNGLLLTNKEIDILNRYDIDYKSCISLKEILYKIEDVINEEDDILELDMISSSIAERDYYQNTNK